jgi:hypothetical protein
MGGKKMRYDIEGLDLLVDHDGKDNGPTAVLCFECERDTFELQLTAAEARELSVLLDQLATEVEEVAGQG